MENKIRLILLGDVMLGRGVGEILKLENAQYVWGNTLGLLRKANFRMCNLECVLTDEGEPWSVTPKTFHFKSDPKNVSVLTAAKINLVSLANNHALDFGYEALFKMHEILKRSRIKQAGSGKNMAEASKAVISRVKKVRVGVLAFSNNEPVWEALRKRPGIFYLPIDTADRRMNYLKNAITAAREKSDVLIISAHWGPNLGSEPSPQHLEFGKLLIDLGADIVFGHSSHVFRGIELYKNKPIIYNAGDLIDDYPIDPVEHNDWAFIYEVEIAAGQLKKLFLYPAVIREFKVLLAEKEEALNIAKKMKELCLKLNTKAEWNEKEKRLEIDLGKI